MFNVMPPLASLLHFFVWSFLLVFLQARSKSENPEQLQLKEKAKAVS